MKDGSEKFLWKGKEEKETEEMSSSLPLATRLVAVDCGSASLGTCLEIRCRHLDSGLRAMGKWGNDWVTMSKNSFVCFQEGFMEGELLDASRWWE